jgi:hypothetical protein
VTLQQGQWADALLAAERVQATRLLAWSLLSVVVGTALLAAAYRRTGRPPLLFHFGAQHAAWGVLQAALALSWRAGASLRDLPGAIALERLAWFGAGLDTGIILVGATLAVAGRTFTRPALIGAGVAVAVQGAARLLLDLQLSSIVVR